MPHFIRPRPLAWFLFLSAFATAIALGSWQIKRLEWKEGLITEIEAAKTQPPLTVLPGSEAELKAKNFYPVALDGEWISGTEFHITPRFFKGKLGYFVIAPFALADERVLLINRGWVPTEKKLPETRPETAVHGRTTIHGMVRYGDERNWLTPINQPERNLWFGRDVREMAAHASIANVVPAMVDLVGEQNREHLPVPYNGTIKLRNDHLSYIITWFGIALGILIIFLMSHRKK